MAKRKAIEALEDILNVMEEVETYIRGHDLGSYRGDMMLRRSVERCLEIDSEASRRISDGMKAKFPEVSWPEIRALGNIIRHEYGAVDEEVIWQTATQSLPELKPIVVKLLENAQKN